MPRRVAEAMVEASRNFVHLNELQQRAGERVALLTGADSAFICAGAASGMYLSGAACLAALLQGRVELTAHSRVVLVLSGGNVDVARLGELLR